MARKSRSRPNSLIHVEHYEQWFTWWFSSGPAMTLEHRVGKFCDDYRCVVPSSMHRLQGLLAAILKLHPSGVINGKRCETALERIFAAHVEWLQQPGDELAAHRFTTHNMSRVYVLRSFKHETSNPHPGLHRYPKTNSFRKKLMEHDWKCSLPCCNCSWMQRRLIPNTLLKSR